jgi:hypothetical protein
MSSWFLDERFIYYYFQDIFRWASSPSYIQHSSIMTCDKMVNNHCSMYLPTCHYMADPTLNTSLPKLHEHGYTRPEHDNTIGLALHTTNMYRGPPCTGTPHMSSCYLVRRNTRGASSLVKNATPAMPSTTSGDVPRATRTNPWQFFIMGLARLHILILWKRLDCGG